jgi:hypothetical protein
MHQRRLSKSFSIEVLDVMKNGKWMLKFKKSTSHEKSHISKCQSLLNQDKK